MGLAKRRLFKPDRKPARKKGSLEAAAPLSCLDANRFEITAALYSICDAAGMVVGRAGDYDSLRDTYTVIAKSKSTGKAQELTVQGEEVGFMIGIVRQMNGGPLRADLMSKKRQRVVGLRG
jgi:hypothetical protein